VRIIPVEDLKEGMIVAEDVYTPSSQLLVAGGTKITQSLKRSLIRYDINNIKIEEEEAEEKYTKEEIFKIQEEYGKNLVEKFRIFPSEPMMKTLFDTILEIKAKELEKCLRQE